MSDRKVTIEVIFLTQTELAVCVTDDSEGEAVWLPKSLIHWDRENDYGRGECIELTAPEWLLKRENLI